MTEEKPKEKKKQKIFPVAVEQPKNEQFAVPDASMLPGMPGFEEISTGSNDSSDSFFKSTVRELNSPKNISMKTEYRNVQENFAGAKLSYLGEFYNIPGLPEFMVLFETKRVSLERKGRIEIIKALQERRQEIELEQRRMAMMGMGGMMGGGML